MEQKKVKLANKQVMWKSKGKNGTIKQIPINKLTDAHLLNAKRSLDNRLIAIQQKLNTLLEVYDAIELEAEKRQLVEVEQEMD
jgi:hypothetical protein